MIVAAAAGWCLYEKPTDLKGDECEERHSPVKVLGRSHVAEDTPYTFRCHGESPAHDGFNCVICVYIYIYYTCIHISS